MMDMNEELKAENLTQKDIMTFLLHSTQHAATREGLQSVRAELKTEIQDVRVEIQNVKSELKAEIQDVRVEIQTVKSELKAEIQTVKSELKADINKLDSKFDRMQWLIVATIITILVKDYIFALPLFNS